MIVQQPRAMRVAVGITALFALGSQPAGAGARPLARPTATAAHAFSVTIITMAADTRTGRVFVAHAASTSVLDSRSGTLLRTVPVGGTAVAVDTRTRRVFVANGENTVSMLDSRSGQRLRAIPLGATELAVDSHGGQVFAADLTGHLYALDARSGALLRTIPIDQYAFAVAVDEQRGRVFVLSGGPRDHGILIRGYGRVSVLDTHGSTVLHTLDLGLDQYPIAAAVDSLTGRVFVAHDDNTIGVLDASSGMVLRTVLAGPHLASLAVDTRAGRVFVTNTDGNTVSVLDARSGMVLRTVPVGEGPSGVAADEQSGRIFVANSNEGTVSVLDARSGSVLRTSLVGRDPAEVAVDARAGHAFVETAHGVRMLDATSGQLLPMH